MERNNVEHFLITKILNKEVLKMGSFQLNSGVTSKFYYDFSNMSDAKSLYDLGFVISQFIKEKKLPIEVVVGSAYKGIPLAVATVHYTFINSERTNLEWAFDRKEPKVHGEKGNMVGANLEGKNVLIVDDVVTSGKAFKRTIETVKLHKPKSIFALALIARNESPIELEIPWAAITHHSEVLKRYNG